MIGGAVIGGLIGGAIGGVVGFAWGLWDPVVQIGYQSGETFYPLLTIGGNSIASGGASWAMPAYGLVDYGQIYNSISQMYNSIMPGQTPNLNNNIVLGGQPPDNTTTADMLSQNSGFTGAQSWLQQLINGNNSPTYTDIMTGYNNYQTGIEGSQTQSSDPNQLYNNR
jgi:hypothetical protein